MILASLIIPTKPGAGELRYYEQVPFQWIAVFLLLVGIAIYSITFSFWTSFGDWIQHNFGIAILFGILVFS